MRKKTKQLLTKLGIAMAAIAGSGYFLFGKKNEKKEPIKIKEDKDNNELFI